MVEPNTQVIDTTTTSTTNTYQNKNKTEDNANKMSSSSAERNETNNNVAGVGGEDRAQNNSNNVMAETNGNHSDVPDNAQLISRTTQQVKTQQVKTVTKVYTTREVRHFGPDGLPIDPPVGAGNYENAPPVSSATGTVNTNEYTNFPGPKTEGAVVASADNFNDYNPHYSNTGFNQLQPSTSSTSGAQQQPSPSPGSGSTANTGSTAVAASFVNTQTRMYDPYTVNSQIGYQQQHQDYSNINNYQELAHLNELAAAAASASGQALPPGTSPQPPIRRHGPGAHPAGDEAFVPQGPQGPIAYGYAPVPPGGPPLPIHSPGQAIYTNYEEAPQGYLDR